MRMKMRTRANTAKVWIGLFLPAAGILACAAQDEVAETRQALTAIPDTSQVANFGVYASDRLDLANFASITSTLVGANGIVWVETDARINGTVVSGTEIDLRDRTAVTGDARSTGAINLGNNAVVNGVRVSHVAVAMPAGFSISAPTAGSVNDAVYPGQSRTLGPGSYGDVTVFSNGTLTLNGDAAGASYSFRRLVFEAGATLIMNASGGVMSIGIADALSVGDRVRTVLNGASDGRSIKWNHNGTATLRVGTDVRPFYGIIAAPNARVELADRSALNGAIRAKSVRIGVASAVTGFAEATTCPAGHRSVAALPGVCVNYVEETYTGEFVPPWMRDRGITKFFETHVDEFDMVLFFPATERPSSNYSRHGNQVLGINQRVYTPPNYPYLQGAIEIDEYPSYLASSSNTLNTIHEMMHNWGIEILGLYADPTRVPPGHWPNNIDLFRGARFLDPVQYVNWIQEGGNDMCIGQHNFAGWKMSDLSLYLMGLLPPEQVGAIKMYDFEPRPDDSNYNTWGPGCLDEPAFTGTRTITIDDIIMANGPRVPAAASSPKDFKVAFVVVWPYGQSPELGFLRHVHEFKQSVSTMWFELSGGRSRLFID